MQDCSILNKKLEIIGEQVKIKHLYGIDVHNSILEFLKLKHQKKQIIKEKICKILFND